MSGPIPVTENVVFVGDVHGCHDELKELVDEWVPKGTSIICVGDLVNKGPKVCK